jgi:hypothetical protein
VGSVHLSFNKNGTPLIKTAYTNDGGGQETKEVCVQHVLTLAENDVLTIDTITTGSFAYNINDATFLVKRL